MVLGHGTRNCKFEGEGGTGNYIRPNLLFEGSSRSFGPRFRGTSLAVLQGAFQGGRRGGVGVPAVHEVSDVGADPRLEAARALDLDRLLHPALEGIVELHDLAAGDQAVRLDLGEHGEAGGGAHAGQADVQLALGEDLRVDAAGVERQALRLVDGDGVGELERDLGICTHDGGLDPVDGPALIVHLDDGLGLVDLPSVPLDADLLVHPVELDRHGVRGRVGDGALRAVDVTLLRAVHERHHAGAAAQDDPLRRHLVAV